MKIAALSLLLALAVLPLVQGSRKCTNPKVEDGESYTEGCLQMTCKGGVWRPSLTTSLCCYNRQAYLPNTNITILEDGCATAVIHCRLDDNVATAVVLAENNCGKPSTEEQAQEIKDLLVNYLEHSDCATASSTTTMPTHVTERKMLNPVVLLTGGNNCRSVEVYSPLGSCNKDLEDLPLCFTDHSIDYFNGDVIICGGQQYSSKCLFLDHNQRFIEHSQLNQPHSYHVGSVVSNTLTLVSSNNVSTWNGFQWETSGFDEIKDLQSDSCMDTISKDTLFMVGGYSDIREKYSNKLMKYYKNDQIQAGVWEQMENFPGPARYGLGCAFIETPEGDSFIIAGGTTSENPYQDTSFLYNIQKNTWEEVGRLNHVRLGGVIAVLNGKVLMLGGSYAPTVVEEYDVETKTWSITEQQIKQSRGQFDAVVVPGALVGC